MKSTNQKPASVLPDNDGADWLGKTKLLDQPGIPLKSYFKSLNFIYWNFLLTD